MKRIYMRTIKNILNVKPYNITVMFDNNEKREINFEQIIKNFPVLKDEKIFASVSLDDYPTLKWDNLATIIDYDGKEFITALDFCPDTLYQLSTEKK